MTFSRKNHVKCGRKAHRCDYCAGTIPEGAESEVIVQHWDGYFSSWRGHPDCVALWEVAYQDHGDFDEGMPIDLVGAIARDEAREIVQHEYDLYRGFFPHAICRLELRWQRGDINRRDRYIAQGLEPDPEDCPEVYG